VGAGMGPVQAYLDVEGIVALAAEKGVDLIHPGYGFLSENPALPRACEKAGITFVGPTRRNSRNAGRQDRRAAPGAEGRRARSARHGHAVSDFAEAGREGRRRIGFPLILKAAFGGGGRGMRVVGAREELAARYHEASSEALAAFGNGAVFLERYIAAHGTSRCRFWATARQPGASRGARLQRAAAPSEGGRGGAGRRLDPRIRAALCEAAVKLARAAGYVSAGTVEFLVDADTGEWFFIEVNPRIQVEHTVTEMVTGIDLVRAQIQVAQGLELHGRR
jgi:pyruvate carboxylase